MLVCCLFIFFSSYNVQWSDFGTYIVAMLSVLPKVRQVQDPHLPVHSNKSSFPVNRDKYFQVMHMMNKLLCRRNPINRHNVHTVGFATLFITLD